MLKRKELMQISEDLKRESDVEHFRPKGRVNENLSATLLYPGYYWLAYDWKNLFLCKSKMNVSHKMNFFPLEDESDRNRSHRDNNPEHPLLIDPSSTDPRQHIRFHKDEPYHLSERGRVTIELLKNQDYIKISIVSLLPLN